MAKREDVINVLMRMKDCKPSEWFDSFDKFEEGSSMLLEYLYFNRDRKELYASNIADELKISRARVGALISKLKSLGYVSTIPSLSDARIDNISITEEGTKKVKSCHEELFVLVDRVIDRIGCDKVNEFLDLCEEIKDVLKEEVK